jgi:hypothetical protein
MVLFYAFYCDIITFMKRCFPPILLSGLLVTLIAAIMFLVLTRVPACSDVHSGLIGAILSGIVTSILIAVAWKQLDSMNKTSRAGVRDAHRIINFLPSRQAETFFSPQFPGHAPR